MNEVIDTRPGLNSMTPEDFVATLDLLKQTTNVTEEEIEWLKTGYECGYSPIYEWERIGMDDANIQLTMEKKWNAKEMEVAAHG